MITEMATLEHEAWPSSSTHTRYGESQLLIQLSYASASKSDSSPVCIGTFVHYYDKYNLCRRSYLVTLEAIASRVGKSPGLEKTTTRALFF